MAYNHNQREILLALAASTASLAVVGRWAPGTMPTIFKRIALVFKTAAAAAGNAAIKRYPTAGDATNAVLLDNIVFDGTIGAAGNVVYVEMEAEILPGEELVVEIDDVAASGVADIKALVEDRWEHPDNIPDMVETA